MFKDYRDSNQGGWLPAALVGTTVLRDAYHYSVPQAAGADAVGRSPVVAASVEEKISDLIRSYPHLAAFLRSHAKDPNARIRDLEISTKERDHLLYEIIAARRQQLFTLGNAGRISLATRDSRLRPVSRGPRRKRLPQ